LLRWGWRGGGGWRWGRRRRSRSRGLLLGGFRLWSLLRLGLELLGVPRAPTQTGEIAGVHEIHGNGFGFGHAQLALRLDGEEGPCQNRRVQNDGGRQPAPHCCSLAAEGYVPSVSVTSETLVNP